MHYPGGLVAERMAEGTTGSYLFDLQGNTAEIITGTGVKVNAAYNAWGQCNYMNPVPFPNNPFMQHSYNARWRYLLDETGLYYCQNRYYDPGTGRFLTRDPIGYSGGMNLYGYCGGGPVGLMDAEGTAIVRLIAYTVVDKLGVQGWHMGILVLDNAESNGHSFAGGPSAYGVGSVVAAALESKSKPWKKGGQDYDQWQRHPASGRMTMTLIQDCEPVSTWVKIFNDIEDQIKSQPKKLYRPIPGEEHDLLGRDLGSANSNTWAKYLLQQAGLMNEYERAKKKRMATAGWGWFSGWDIRSPFVEHP